MGWPGEVPVGMGGMARSSSEMSEDWSGAWGGWEGLGVGASCWWAEAGASGCEAGASVSCLAVAPSGGGLRVLLLRCVGRLGCIRWWEVLDTRGGRGVAGLVLGVWAAAAP